MLNGQRNTTEQRDTHEEKTQFSPPNVSLPKGGGAIRGIGEKFAANPVTGTGSMSVPIAVSPGRSGFGPQLSLSYDSGSGNGPFGFGWSLSLPSITRKTDKGLPKYQDADDSDVFILSGAEDLIPALTQDTHGEWQREEFPRDGYIVRRYRPRIEGLFARIERWTRLSDGDTHWRSVSRDNVTTLYGKTAESRIADPYDSMRVFRWLICESYDDKGNAIVYQYKPENSDGVDLSQTHERNRTPTSRSANRYLKRIKYGNRVSRLLQPDLSQAEWLFEVVFDYGEHDPSNPTPNDDAPWRCRSDSFSSYRAAFEVRTYRLCQRVLMFHHFPEEMGTDDSLVRSTEFTYSQTPIASFITSVTHSGYTRQVTGGYLKKSLPSLEFEYSEAILQEDIREIDVKSLENLPSGPDGARYQWVDLDGEGLSGILSEQAQGWFYKRNLGEAQFGPVEVVTPKPLVIALSSGQQLLDLAGDGQLDLVTLDSPTPGFFERTEGAAWESFRAFSSLPNLAWGDPNLRFVDLTGDGHADILRTQDDHFTWYRSLAEEGFATPEFVSLSNDEEKGPRLVFADSTQSVYLADVSGDGLSDLVRIRNGEVCYWPNLGYGRFGAKVMMDNAPWFDAPDLFDQRRIRLADIDGSGVTDIIYLGRNGVALYFNQSGNGWDTVRTLSQFPRIDDLSIVQVTDLLGNGTACLVWSSSLPGDIRSPMRYIDLMGGQKPHLLIKSQNNLGAETAVHYVSSTKFYLADELAGKPWLTRLPFPVHVVERVETYDHVSRNRFVTRYAYHHGYFDGIEREFRGFGMVEQWDTEEFAALSASGVFPTGDNIDATSHIPPVHTKTWFHTGAYIEGSRVTKQFEDEYYREGDASLGESGITNEQQQAMLLPNTLLPEGLIAEEEREACRALKGAILRQEVYAEDGTEEADRPYSVSERNYTIELLQPHGENQYAVFFIHAREQVDFQYERNLYDILSEKRADPRVTHGITLEVDDFGNVLKSVAVGYGRRFGEPGPLLTSEDRQKQRRMLITYTESRVTNPVLESDAYRTPLPCEACTYELLNIEPDSIEPNITNLFRFEEMLNKVAAASDGAHDLPYEDIAATGAIGDEPYRRLIERVRTLYRADDLGGPLPFGQLESLALPFENYKLAFTRGLIASVYGSRVTDDMLAIDGKYVHSEADTDWWIPSGRLFFSADTNDSPQIELSQARVHFFLPRRFHDPFGQTTTVTYDGHDLLVTETSDPLGNSVTALNDYRVLQPKLTTDPNGNRSAVAFDALGMVVGTAAMGKISETKGDSLDGFVADLDEAPILAHIQNPFADSHSILQQATSRLIYDLFAYTRTGSEAQPQPAVVYTLVRETHDADLPSGQQSKIQHSFSYSDGFGREIQKKIQAEPGPLVEGGATVNPRWVGSGWAIFNNKGKPVRQYEPFFSATHAFEFARTIGVSPVLFYDPVGRVVATLHPNHTYEKVVFDPWRQETWDVNDMVLEADPRDDADVGDSFRRLLEVEYLPTWYEQRASGAMGTEEQAAATKAAAHADTPTVAYADTLGRTFLTVAHNRLDRNGVTVDEQYATRVELDIEGNQRAVIDALDRIVMRYDYDLLSVQIHSSSMEAGERWLLNDVAGKPIYAWNSRGHRLRTTYDALRRPTEVFLQEGNEPELLVGRTVHGEGQPDPETNNLRGKVYQSFDCAGVVTSEEYDFKGNLLRSSRQLAVEYKKTVDWSGTVALETQVFTASTMFDALNRPLTLTTPDNSVIRPTYNEANLLERVEANLRGSTTVTTFVQDIDYNAKGQRELIEYGNGTSTTYEYDPLTFRLTHLQTTRGADRLQDLFYTYDPVGNITHIQDDAQQAIYFNNAVVEPHADYTYDAIYQLIHAEGREHIGQVSQPETIWNDEFRANLMHPHDGQAMRRYGEQYEYDAVGNILQMIHQATNGNWTRDYTYTEPSLIEPGNVSNRLSSTTVGSTAEPYTYDTHGNMTNMPHLSVMRWNYLDQLEATSQQVVNNGNPETTYYIYDASGQRVRKVTERQAAAGETPTRMNERFYLGGFEVYREYDGSGASVTLERETLLARDGAQRIVLVETKTVDTQHPAPSTQHLIRYQISNHLGSSSLELDETGQIISYEEYYPYGSTSYQAMDTAITAAAKRYRYTGKERDEETGFNYHGARYYAPWLGRWCNTDPAGTVDSLNLFEANRNNPVIYIDLTGTNPLLLYVLILAGGVLIPIQDTGRGTNPYNNSKIKQDLRSVIETYRDVGLPVSMLETVGDIENPEGTIAFNYSEEINIFNIIDRSNHYQPFLNEVFITEKAWESESQGKLVKKYVDDIYHEFTHAFLALNEGDDELKRITEAGINYYKDAPLLVVGGEGGEVANDPERVFQEAAAMYVAYQVTDWLETYKELQGILEDPQKEVSAVRLEQIRKNYNDKRTNFGYQPWRGSPTGQAETTKPISAELKNYLDRVVLEGKIPANFDDNEILTGLVNQIKEQKIVK